MIKVSFDSMCREVLECEHYIEWELDMSIADHGRNYESTMTCVSCQLFGESYNIDEYPKACAHKEALDEFKVLQIKAHKAFEKKCEQEDMWKRLEETN